MTRKRFSLAGLGPLLAVVGVGFATAGSAGTASDMAVPLLGALGLLATLLLKRLQKNPDDGAFLANLIFLGVAVRLLLYVFIHQTVGPYVFAPDQFTYENEGMRLLLHWQGHGAMPSQLGGSLQVGYGGINAIVFAIFGVAKRAPAVLNIFFSAWTAIPAYYLAMMVVRENRGVAKLAAGLTVFFPSLILWSVLNIRESPTILTLTCTLYFAVRLQRRATLPNLIGVAAGLFIVALFREYMTFLVGSGIVAGLLMGKSRSPVRAFIAGSLAMFVVVYAAQVLGFGSSLSAEPTLSHLQTVRQGFLYGANSAYGAGANVSTAGGAIRFLPTGLTYFLLAPFPWSIGSILQAITLPETLFWYAILPMGLWGAWLGIRHDPRAFTVPLSALIVVTFAYAMVEANVGTAYRHRAQILPIIFVFCALGIRDLQAVRQIRKQRSLERRRQARELTASGATSGGRGSSR